jgi:hypothetical protein
MNAEIAIYHTSADDMARKQPKPAGPVSARLTPDMLERLARLMDGLNLSKNEALQALFLLGVERAEAEPGLLLETHLRIEREKKIKK